MARRSPRHLQLSSSTAGDDEKVQQQKPVSSARKVIPQEPANPTRSTRSQGRSNLSAGPLRPVVSLRPITRRFRPTATTTAGNGPNDTPPLSEAVSNSTASETIATNLETDVLEVNDPVPFAAAEPLKASAGEAPCSSESAPTEFSPIRLSNCTDVQNEILSDLAVLNETWPTQPPSQGVTLSQPDEMMISLQQTVQIRDNQTIRITPAVAMVEQHGLTELSAGANSASVDSTSASAYIETLNTVSGPTPSASLGASGPQVAFSVAPMLRKNQSSAATNILVNLASQSTLKRASTSTSSESPGSKVIIKQFTSTGKPVPVSITAQPPPGSPWGVAVQAPKSSAVGRDDNSSPGVARSQPVVWQPISAAPSVTQPSGISLRHVSGTTVPVSTTSSRPALVKIPISPTKSPGRIRLLPVNSGGTSGLKIIAPAGSPAGGIQGLQNIVLVAAPSSQPQSPAVTKIAFTGPTRPIAMNTSNLQPAIPKINVSTVSPKTEHGVGLTPAHLQPSPGGPPQSSISVVSPSHFLSSLNSASPSNSTNTGGQLNLTIVSQPQTKTTDGANISAAHNTTQIRLSAIQTPQGGFLPLTGTTAKSGVAGVSNINVTTSSPAAGGNLHTLQIPGGRVGYIRLLPSGSPGSLTLPTQANRQPTMSTLSQGESIEQSGATVDVTSVLNSSSTLATNAVPVSANATLRLPVSLPVNRQIPPRQSGVTQTQLTGGSMQQRLLLPATTVSQMQQQQSQSQQQSATVPGGITNRNLSALPNIQNQLNQLAASSGTPLSLRVNGNVVQGFVVPAQYITQNQNSSTPKYITVAASNGQTTTVQSISTTNQAIQTNNKQQQQQHLPTSQDGIVPPALFNGIAVSAHVAPASTPSESQTMRQRKPCNCTKSQCLKLYCECFANGEFCNSCNCTNCNNNLDHESERAKAIKSCLERNPQAFHPKIGKGSAGEQERRHTKGCNCKRSGCLKNYCECYEAKILCSSNCRCIGCRNFEESPDRKNLMDLANAAEYRVQLQNAAKSKHPIHDITKTPSVANSGERMPFSLVTSEVVDATCACLLAQAEEAEVSSKSFSETEKMVLEEFGRCVMKIIQSAQRTKGNSRTS